MKKTVRSMLSLSLLFVLCLGRGMAQTDADYTPLTELSLSGNGNTIAITGRLVADPNNEDGGIYPIDIFDAHTGQLIKSIENIVPRAKGIALNFDGSLMAYYTRYGNAEIIDIMTEERVFILQGGGATQSYPVRWARDVNLVATYDISFALIGDVASQRLQGFPNDVETLGRGMAAVLNNDGTLLAHTVFGSGIAHTLIWDVAFNIPNGMYNSPRLLVDNVGGSNLSWSPDSSKIASTNRGKIDLIDIQTGTVSSLQLPNPEEIVSSVAWSPDGTKIAGGLDQSGVWVWDVETGTVIAQYPTEFRVNSVAWSPDSTLVYHTGGSAGVYINGMPMGDFMALGTVPQLTPTTSP